MEVARLLAAEFVDGLAQQRKRVVLGLGHHALPAQLVFGRTHVPHAQACMGGREQDLAMRLRVRFVADEQDEIAWHGRGVRRRREVHLIRAPRHRVVAEVVFGRVG